VKRKVNAVAASSRCAWPGPRREATPRADAARFRAGGVAASDTRQGKIGPGGDERGISDASARASIASRRLRAKERPRLKARCRGSTVPGPVAIVAGEILEQLDPSPGRGERGRDQPEPTARKPGMPSRSRRIRALSGRRSSQRSTEQPEFTRETAGIEREHATVCGVRLSVRRADTSAPRAAARCPARRSDDGATRRVGAPGPDPPRSPLRR
jgi:hypothetical protein